jgi:hypothetical protein
MNSNDHKDHIKALNRTLETNGLPFFDSEYLGRDSLVKYCVSNKVSLLTESIPLEWLTYEPYDLGPDAPKEDADEWGHNLKLANIFIKYLSEKTDQVHIISETFAEEPTDRAISLSIADWDRFVSTDEMQFNLIGDIIIFDRKYNEALIFFHHEQIHLLSLSGNAKSIMTELRN